MADHPILTPSSGLSPHTGPLASAAWLVARGLLPNGPRWYVTLAFDVDEAATFEELDLQTSTRFQIEIFSEEWGFRFCHRGRISWIRITDIPFVHGRDDYALLRETPALRNIGTLMRAQERLHDVAFARYRPLIQTSLVGADHTLREWAATL